MSFSGDLTRRCHELRRAGCEIVGPTRMGGRGQLEPDYSGDEDQEPYWVCVIVMPTGAGSELVGRGPDEEEAVRTAVEQAEARLSS